MFQRLSVTFVATLCKDTGMQNGETQSFTDARVFLN